MSASCIRRVTRPGLAMGVCAVLLSGSAWGIAPRESASPLAAREFFAPELYLSSANAALEDVLPQLANRAAWDEYLRGRAGDGARVRAFVDPRSGAATSLLVADPLLPGRNRLTLADLSARLGRRVDAVDARAVAEAAWAWVDARRAILGVQADQLGPVRASQVHENLWQVSIPQVAGGVRVRDARLVLTISHGNVILAGTQTWGAVALRATPSISAEKALDAGFEYAGGRSLTDTMAKQPELEIVPFAPRDYEVASGAVGRGYGHRLVWSFSFQRAGDEATWETLVDAHSGEVLAFQDTNHYIAKSITGGVYPVTATNLCSAPANPATQCGVMQGGWPMPWADTGFAGVFTNSGGAYNYTAGTAKTTLSGLFVKISDRCGQISESSATGSINMGGVDGQHDCTSAGASRGDTPASRTAFYEVNKLAEMARGWLPGNAWLNAQLTANVNIRNTCNAFWNGSTINFYRSGGGCRNTGELAGVFDHEWGHGLDDNDAAGVLSNSSEAYADVAAILRLQASCVGHGFFDASVAGSCGLTVDGTGRNADEDQTAATHCNLDCSGVRDADWDKHVDHAPDTPQNHVCVRCSGGTGPCGAQVHCAAAPVRQAAWDLAARDLPAAGYDSQSSFIIANKLFYQGSGNVGAWHACNCAGGTSDGCGAANGYMQWLAADDVGDGIANGTPHMTAIHAAFNRHNIACAAPAPTNSGCSALGSATLTTVAGSFSAALSWSAVPGAGSYWVFRTEGHAGCNFGKALIATVAGGTTTYTDTQVLAGRAYSYNVVAVGNTAACFGNVSNCSTVTPLP